MVDKNSIEILRKKYLPPSLRLSYSSPLHIVKGDGQYLYDEKGRQYLDAVNNIQHVGHCHPTVIKAAQNQFEKLNTNTRYLDETIVYYAAALSKKLPKKLDVCFFTNSGSESNDLALRIARTISDSKETIVLDGAYHGNLSSMIEISPYKHNGPGGSGAPEYVHTVPMPDKFRGKYRGKDSGQKYINEVMMIIDEIHSSNKVVSAFIVESLMGCGGQVVLPDGFLKDAFQIVREAGGICITDEVQIGFGRMGTHFWGFETQDVIPDIVTMGKSMGNGHPLSAVVTTKEIVDKFNTGMEYFNSFGGNPVSCAVGHAVLDVIEKEHLQKNALDVGHYLKNLLEKLKIDYDIIGDVRGHGLFLGIELVRSHRSLEPADKEAHQIVNAMKEMGVLISADGPYHNVLKIKPPMVFTRDNALFLVETLENALLLTNK